MPPDCKLTLRLPEEVRDFYAEMGRQQRRSLNSELVAVLEHYMHRWLEREQAKDHTDERKRTVDKRYVKKRSR